MSEECGSCEYNRQCFIKKNVGIFECKKEKIRVVRYEDYEKLENIIKEVKNILLCYGETFDLKVHQEMQKELLEILGG